MERSHSDEVASSSVPGAMTFLTSGIVAPGRIALNVILFVRGGVALTELILINSSPSIGFVSSLAREGSKN